MGFFVKKFYFAQAEAACLPKSVTKFQFTGDRNGRNKTPPWGTGWTNPECGTVWGARLIWRRQGPEEQLSQVKENWECGHLTWHLLLDWNLVWTTGCKGHFRNDGRQVHIGYTEMMLPEARGRMRVRAGRRGWGQREDMPWASGLPVSL